MGQDSNNRYAAPHVWNLIAKVLRDNEPRVIGWYDDALAEDMHDRLVVAFADRLSEDDGFDRDNFLRRCRLEVQS